MPHPDRLQPRRLLLDAYRAGLEAVDGERLVAGALDREALPGPVVLVAAGKAALPMARGAERVLGGRVRCGLVVGTQASPSEWRFPCRVLAGEHPVPGPGSLAAGEALLELLDAAPRDAQCLFLVSGGVSSLVAVPAEGVELGDLRRANEWLLGSGLDIRQVNAVRRGLSRIKGGRLARYLGEREALVLALSDVPGNDPAVIGSGWLAPSGDDPLPAGLPAWLSDLAGNAPAPPAAADPVWRRVATRIVGDITTALKAAADSLRRAGLPVTVVHERLAGEAAERGRELGRALAAGPPGATLWGGECTVTLPGSPGRGGRCQHLALAAARELAGSGNCWLLAAGTDGRDGDSDAAGALVDGGTIERATTEGLSADDALARADSGTFLEASGDLVDTGPTATNVNDLVIGLKASSRDRPK